MNFVVFSSESFMPRTKVCISSIKKYHPEATIHLVPVNSPLLPGGSYLDGLAKDRLTFARNLLMTVPGDVIVIGADCVLYSRLDVFTSMPGDVILTPHIITPTTGAERFYKTGHANADLILFRNYGGRNVLDWLIAQPLVDNTSAGIFYEQTWLSALPFIFDGISIYKDPTINYAYFNMHERSLVRFNERYYVNKCPLTMVQFSGYIVGSPEKASKYSSIENSGANLELFQEYERSIQ